MNLGDVVRATGDVDAAQALFERSLALREKVLGPAHHEVAESLAGLAECARRQGRPKDAEALFERFLALCRRPEGGYYPRAAETLHGLRCQIARLHPSSPWAKPTAPARAR